MRSAPILLASRFPAFSPLLTTAFLVFRFCPAKITLTSPRLFGIILAASSGAEVAQSVEQWTENPCVGSSILPLGILISLVT